MFSRQNTELFGELENIYLEVVAQSSFYEKRFLKHFAKFGKHLCLSLLFNEVVSKLKRGTNFKQVKASQLFQLFLVLPNIFTEKNILFEK